MKQIIVSGLVLILIAGVITIFPVFASPDPPKVYIDPKDNIFSTDDTSVGDSFTVNIATSGWVDPGLYSYQLNLYYDNALLEAVSAGLPDDHFLAEGPGFNPVFDPIHHDEGYVSFGYAHMGPVAGDTGSGVFGFVTFEVTQTPPLAGSVSCALELSDTIWLDPTSADVLVDVEDGYYEFAAPGLPLPWLKVEPELSGAAEIGDEVIIDVTINEVEEALRLVGVEFKLHYDTTLLETKVEWITEGDFIKSFGATDFVVNVENDYVSINITLLTEEPPFPKESGTLATIKLKATYIPETLTTSDLLLNEVTLLDVEANEISYDSPEHGHYQVPTTIKPEDLNGDGVVNIKDITIWASAFGSRPGHPRWSEDADIDNNGVVNIRDAIKIAMNFGKTY